MTAHFRSAAIAATFVAALLLPGARNAQAQGSIAGVVTDSASGSPVAEATVVARDAGGRTYLARTSAQGRFQLVGLTPGTYDVSVRIMGATEGNVRGVRVEPGATTDVSLAMARYALLLDPTIVLSTGSPRNERLEDIPQSAHVITLSAIEKSPVVTVADHLRKVPGVDIMQSGLFGTNPVARGFNNVFSGSMLVMTDYRLASVPSLRVNAAYLVPTVNEDIEQIEVVLGPGAAVYGPNSANGVMHVVSRSPFTSKGTTVSLGGGDRSMLTAAGRHAGTLGSRFGYKLSGQYMRGEDWQAFDAVEADNRIRNPSNPLIGRRDFRVERFGMEARADFRPREGTEIIAGIGSTQAGSAIEMTGAGAAQVRDWRYDYYQLRARSGNLFAQAFVNSSNAGGTYLLRTGMPVVDKSRVGVAQIQHGLDLGASQRFTYGIDFQRTEPRTESTVTGRNEDDDTIDERGAYLHSLTRLSRRLDFVGAIRVDEHSRLENRIWSPRAALVIKPRADQTFRLTFNQAFSTPTTNNLFLDFVAQPNLSGLPFAVRTFGVPETGLAYRRDCPTGVGGLCMRTPPTWHAIPVGFIPADATQLWVPMTQVLYAASSGAIDIRNVPAPSAAQVGTVLKQLNATDGSFLVVQPSDLEDVQRMKPVLSTVYEAGYRGFLGQRIMMTADVYTERKRDFIGPLVVETPNAFHDSAGVAGYLRAVGYPQPAAEAIAGQVAKIPVGTVTFDHPYTASQDLVLTYRNFGKVDLWGADFGVEAQITNRIALTGTYSHISRDYFSREDVGGISDIALNAPRHKGSLGIRFDDSDLGLTLGARGRHTSAFPMNTGVYVGRIKTYNLLDLSMSYSPAFARNARFSIEATNVLNHRHSQIVGAPALGRHVLSKMQYTF